MRGISENELLTYIQEHGYVDQHGAWCIDTELLKAKCKELDPWLPIEDAPKEGELLVYMPEARRNKVQAACFYPNIKIIGNMFGFDMPKATHYKLSPEGPK